MLKKPTKVICLEEQILVIESLKKIKLYCFHCFANRLQDAASKGYIFLIFFLNSYISRMHYFYCQFP